MSFSPINQTQAFCHMHEFGNPGKDLNFESVIKKLDNKHLRLIRSEPLQHFLIMKTVKTMKTMLLPQFLIIN
jgi:hypothetical protein